MTSQRGSRVRIPPSPLKAEAELFSLGFSRRRRDHLFSPSVLCTGPHHSRSVSRSAQEDPRHLLSPPTRRETPSKRVLTRTGGMSAPLHSFCEDPISQWILLQVCSTRSGGCREPPLRPQEDRRRSCSPPTHRPPLQAYSGSHRRSADDSAALLRTVLLLRKLGEWNPAVPVSDSR